MGLVGDSGNIAIVTALPVKFSIALCIVSLPQGFYWEGRKNFLEIARPLWGGKKDTNNSKNVFYDQYIFYTILGFFQFLSNCGHSRRSVQ